MADISDVETALNSQFSPRAYVEREQSGLVQQQAIEASMRNRLLGLQVQFAQGLPGAMAAAGTGDSSSNAAATSGASPEAGSDFSLNDAAARQHLFRKYSPVPDVWTPQEQVMRTQAAMSGLAGAVDAVKAQHDARIQGQNALRNKGAQQEFNGLYGVVTAPEGQALDALSLVDPNEAARLKDAGVTDDQVRQHASQLAGLTHTMGQLPVAWRKDGVAVDQTSQLEVPGYDSAVGLGPDERIQLTKAATENVDSLVNGYPAKVQRWRAEGAQSPESWIQQHAQLATSLKSGLPTGSAPTASPSGAPQIPQGTPGLPPGVPGQMPRQVPGSVVLPPAQQPRQAPPDPIFNDPQYKLRAPVIPAGQSAPPAVQDEQKAIAASRTALLQDSADNSKAAGQAIRYYKLASDVLNSGGVTTGWEQERVNQAKAALSQFGINPSWLGDSSKAPELVKALTNAGLQNLKTTYGSKVTQSEVFLNLEHANPSADMPLPALRRLINDQVDNLTYDVGSARRATKYVMTGNDPRQFSTWEQQYYPRQRDAVTPQTSSPASRVPTVNTPQDLAALPKGARFVGPDGKPWVKH